jgi:DNA-binding GntR family transcriptional regulator
MESTETVLPAAADRWLTKSDVAYRSLRGQVLQGVLRPGASLDQESLARELGLSTTPVREALRRLESEGLVIQSAHRAVTVPELTQKELNEIYSIRLELDPYAAQLGAKIASAALRSHVLELSSLSLAALSPGEQMAHNRTLHRAMYAASGNTLMTEILEGLWDRADRYRWVLLRDNLISTKAVEREHVKIAKAFATGNVDALGLLLREHLQGSLVTLKDFFN